MSVSGTGSPPAQGAGEPERKKSERRVPAEVCTILPVEGARVALGLLRAGVALGPARAAPALAGPAHRLGFAGEAKSVSEEAAAPHQCQAYLGER